MLSLTVGRKRGVVILISRSSRLAGHREVKDIQGRYIAIIGKIGGIDLTIINVYAPNEDDPSFFKDIASILAREVKGTIILGGDFNCVLKAKLDRLPTDHGPLAGNLKLQNICWKSCGLKTAGEPRIQRQKILHFCLWFMGHTPELI